MEKMNLNQKFQEISDKNAETPKSIRSVFAFLDSDNNSVVTVSTKYDFIEIGIQDVPILINLLNSLCLDVQRIGVPDKGTSITLEKYAEY